MSKLYLEDVFKLSGVPTYTFVKPMEYQKLIVSLRTKGRGVVVEGPSGIGKTTSIRKALEELELSDKVVMLTARKQGDRDKIKDISINKTKGIIIIDDFHKLDEDIRNNIADFMKTLADEEDKETKIIIIGINKAGDSLVKFAKDLNNRIDTIKIEANPEKKILELIEKGEKALNIKFKHRTKIAKEAHGSFHITQMLCHETCIATEITERCTEEKNITISLEVIKEKVFNELSRVFFEVARKFATGPKLRRDGRAPYLHILYWLAKSNEWSLVLDQAIVDHPEHKGSITQVVEKGYLESFLESHKTEFQDILHYDKATRVLSVEDPKFVYFIRNILWSKFAKQQVGYKNIDFTSIYDFALSFAGADRDIAESIFNKLCEEEIEVFYDKNEQHSILAEDVEEYLAPIYKSEAQFVIVLLSRDYPKRIWTKFESQQFKSRFGEGDVIPIWFSDTEVGFFDETARIGGLIFNRKDNVESQVEYMCSILIKKLSERN